MTTLLVASTPVAPLAGVVLLTLGAMSGVAAGQVKIHERVVDGLLPRVSVQSNAALAALAASVQLRPRFCAVVVLPTKLSGWPVTAPNALAPAPVIAQALTTVVASAPLPLPPEGVTLIEALPVAPTAPPLNVIVLIIAGL